MALPPSGLPRLRFFIPALLTLLLSPGGSRSGSHSGHSAGLAEAFLFTLDQDECFVEKVEGSQNVMVAFVVTKHESFYTHDSNAHIVDVKVVSSEHGHDIAESTGKSEDELYFWSQFGGEYKICFKNRGRTQVTISVDIMEYYAYQNKKSGGGTETVKAEDVDNVKQELVRLQADIAKAHHDSWYSFFLALQHMELSKRVGERVMLKALAQAVLLVLCGAAQIGILIFLFERKMRHRGSKV